MAGACLTAAADGGPAESAEPAADNNERVNPDRVKPLAPRRFITVIGVDLERG